MPQLKTEFACPICKRTTGSSVQIIATEGYLSCPNGHRWNDTASFYHEGPTMEFKVAQTKAPQENRTPFSIPIPIDLERRLKEGYGDKLAENVTAILWQMIEGHAMIVSQSEVQRLTQHLGTKPNNAGELVGLVYAKCCEATDAKMERDQAVSELKAYESMSPGKIVIDLGDQFMAAQSKAKDAEMPLKYWSQKAFVGAIRDNWF